MSKRQYVETGVGDRMQEIHRPCLCGCTVPFPSASPQAPLRQPLNKGATTCTFTNAGGRAWRGAWPTLQLTPVPLAGAATSGAWAHGDPTHTQTREQQGSHLPWTNTPQKTLASAHPTRQAAQPKQCFEAKPQRSHPADPKCTRQESPEDTKELTPGSCMSASGSMSSGAYAAERFNAVAGGFKMPWVR
jgi:hypothetical protein